MRRRSSTETEMHSIKTESQQVSKHLNTSKVSDEPLWSNLKKTNKKPFRIFSDLITQSSVVEKFQINGVGTDYCEIYSVPIQDLFQIPDLIMPFVRKCTRALEFLCEYSNKKHLYTVHTVTNIKGMGGGRVLTVFEMFLSGLGYLLPARMSSASSLTAAGKKLHLNRE